MAIRDVLREVHSDGREVKVMSIHLPKLAEKLPQPAVAVAGERFAGRRERAMERADLAVGSRSRVSRCGHGWTNRMRARLLLVRFVAVEPTISEWSIPSKA